MPTFEYTSYERLMALPGVDGLGADAALKRISLLIDISGDLGRAEGAVRALKWSDALERQGVRDAEAALLEYFRANAWAAQQNVRHRDRSAAWAWEQPEPNAGVSPAKGDEARRLQEGRRAS